MASGGLQPYTWQLVSGFLPNGLGLNPVTGQISGTPAIAVSNSPLTFRVTDSSSPAQTATTVGLTLTVTAASGLTITTSTLPVGQVGAPYSAGLSAVGGTTPYGWQLISGMLPSGLSLNSQTGQISGTATTAVSNAALTFMVTDSSFPAAQSATVNLTITVTSSGLTITTTSLPVAQIGIPYSAMLTALGGVPPLTWSTRRMPDGLILNPQTGQISGTPASTVTSGLIVFSVTDSSTPSQTASVTLALVVTGGSMDAIVNGNARAYLK